MARKRSLYLGARFLTWNPHEPEATALLVDGETILAIGSADDLRAHATGADVVDLGVGVALPGFVDAHIHGMSEARAETEIDLSQCTSLPEAMAKLQEHAAGIDDGEWITGGRWDFTKWGLAQQPDRAALEAAAPHNPVALWSIDYHTLWCNGLAFEAAGIDATTDDPHDGEFDRDCDGRLTGIVREGAAELITPAIPDPSPSQAAEQLRIKQDMWLADGLTGLHEIDGELARTAWLTLRDRGDQHIRVVKYLRTGELKWAKASGWKTGEGDAWFFHGGLKLFADGALGSHTCHMSTPFPATDSTEPHYGAVVTTEDAMVAMMQEAYGAGISPMVHAIGDQAVHHVLEAFERTRSRHAAAEFRLGRTLRRRIEHAQFIRPGDLEKFAELDVVASMQPRHCISDLHLLSSIPLDPALVAYGWPDVLGVGATLAFGSDAPVEPSTPWAAIYAAMTRADISHRSSVYQPQRRISAYAAIEAHTAGAAYAAGREHVSGRLKPGFDADFIVTPVDPLACEGAAGIGESGLAHTFSAAYPDEDALFAQAESIRDARVNVTVVGGEVRFSR